MNAPTVYHVDPVTGLPLGTSEADASPLEPGEWLVPAYATLQAPPKLPAGFAAVLMDGEWTSVEDHRGEKVWTTEGAYIEIAELGPLPPGAAATMPDAVRLQEEADRVAARRAQRNRLLAACDWTQLGDAPLDADTKAAWASYRQSLRDLDMATSVWPVAPGEA
jgi:hypothetical protein